VMLFSARDASRASPQQTLALSTIDWSLANLAIHGAVDDGPGSTAADSEQPPVIPVPVGDTWRDYRPARPQDFVGRKEHQDRIFLLMDAVRARSTATRVFALLGDSGMGKSSLIVKLQNRFQNTRHRGRQFMLAVDVRAARSPGYPYAALVACLTRAADAFGIEGLPAAKVEDQAQPLGSASIQAHLDAFEREGKIVCLVFDQFEELYSKPELFLVFDAMQRLLLDVVGAQSVLVLGFAWKTDATVHQDHPAYHMWHRLSDHRSELTLKPLDSAETSAAVTKFEKELGGKLNPVLRRQIMENSRGLPWLLKMFCIHLLDQIEAGKSQAELIDKALDAKTLFERQLQSLSSAESACLKSIASTTPADWYEIIEAFGVDVLRGLVDKRLVVRSGDRVAVYWDIFREYLLTQTVPHVPLTYLPAAPSMRTLLVLAGQLRSDSSQPIIALSEVAGVAPKTAGNIVRDLVMLGVAVRDGDAARLADGVEPGEEPVLLKLRDALSRHALMGEIRSLPVGSHLSKGAIVSMLRAINPAAHHRRQTWDLYADRMLHWLHACGFIQHDDDHGWRWEDAGETNIEAIGPRRRPLGIFTASAPPEAAVEALAWFVQHGPASTSSADAAGYRNAVNTLGALGLLSSGEDGLTSRAEGDAAALTNAVWSSAMEDDLLTELRAWRSANPSASGAALGAQAARLAGAEWSKGSRMRHGNALRRWCAWLDAGTVDEPAPFPKKRRKRKTTVAARQEALFG